MTREDQYEANREAMETEPSPASASQTIAVSTLVEHSDDEVLSEDARCGQCGARGGRRIAGLTLCRRCRDEVGW
jgi:hypothetical protein